MNAADLARVTELSRLLARAYPGWAPAYAIERAVAALHDVAAADREACRAAACHRAILERIANARHGWPEAVPLHDLEARAAAMSDVRAVCAAERDRRIAEVAR